MLLWISKDSISIYVPSVFVLEKMYLSTSHMSMACLQLDIILCTFNVCFRENDLNTSHMSMAFIQSVLFYVLSE